MVRELTPEHENLTVHVIRKVVVLGDCQADESG